MIKVPAVVLAGGTNSAAMIAATGVQNRALIELKPGKTMLDYVLAALIGARSLSEVIVVGNVPTVTSCTMLPSGADFLANLVKGVQAVTDDSDKVLIVTSDIPFISPAAIDDFVQTALHSRGDFCYPIIPMEDYRKSFAKLKRTTLRTAEGEFTGGNIMMVSKVYIKNHQRTIKSAYAARKNVMALGSMLGWELLGRIVMSKLGAVSALDIPALEAGVSNLLGHGAKARAVISQFASLGTDIDKPADVAIAKQMLGRL